MSFMMNMTSVDDVICVNDFVTSDSPVDIVELMRSKQYSLRNETLWYSSI